MMFGHGDTCRISKTASMSTKSNRGLFNVEWHKGHVCRQNQTEGIHYET